MPRETAITTSFIHMTAAELGLRIDETMPPSLLVQHLVERAKLAGDLEQHQVKLGADIAAAKREAAGIHAQIAEIRESDATVASLAHGAGQEQALADVARILGVTLSHPTDLEAFTAHAEREKRWEGGFRSIVTIVQGPRAPFEIPAIVERVRELARVAETFRLGDLQRLVELRTELEQMRGEVAWRDDAIRHVLSAVDEGVEIDTGRLRAALPRAPAAELPAIDAERLNPGVRGLVQLLRREGFDTRDSGDGQTHEFGCDRPEAYVSIKANPRDLVDNARRLQRLMWDHHVPMYQVNPDSKPCIQATFDPADDTAIIDLRNVTDATFAPTRVELRGIAPKDVRPEELVGASFTVAVVDDLADAEIEVETTEEAGDATRP